MKKLLGFLCAMVLAVLLIFSAQPANAINSSEVPPGTVPTLDAGWAYDFISVAYYDSADSPYDYTLSGAAWFSITDAYVVGDTFFVYDYGSLILTTDFIAFPDYWGDSIPEDYCWESADWGSGQVFLSAGSHSLTIQGDGAGGLGAGFHTRIDSIPEPATMLLLGSGLIGLAVFGRKKLFKK